MSPPSFSLDGCELHCERTGTGPPVLLVHGAGAYAALFGPCADALASTHDVIAYDRRGLSRSKHATVRDLDVHVSDATIRAFLDETARDQKIVVYCYHGNMSKGGTAYLQSQGFTDVYSLAGGFETWRASHPHESSTG